MRKKNLYVLVVTLAVFLLLFLGIKDVKAAPGEVAGWALFGADCTDPTETSCVTTTAPIGWISFSSKNLDTACAGVPRTAYGVYADYDTKEISGYAWVGVGDDAFNEPCDASENSIGWLNFDSLSHPCGTPGYPPAGAGCFPARLVENPPGQWEVQGWAPIISKDSSGAQTIVTWVRFENTGKYSVKINNNGSIGTLGAGSTDHYAWSNFAGGGDTLGAGGGLGWIDFRSSMGEVRFPAVNLKPAAFNLLVTNNPIDYCFSSDPVVVLKWQFFDQDAGDTQSAYQVQVDNDASFSSPEYDTSKAISPSDSYAPPAPSYATTYYWRVKVWDSKGAESEWAYPPSSKPPGFPTIAPGSPFTTLKHRAPWPEFTHLPKNPSAGQTVTFTDISNCWDDSNSIYLCKNGPANTYSWDFGDRSPLDNTRGDTTHIYDEEGTYIVTLSITDNVATCTTTGDSPVSARPALPKYKEISPAAFFSEFFIALGRTIRSFLDFII